MDRRGAIDNLKEMFRAGGEDVDPFETDLWEGTQNHVEKQMGRVGRWMLDAFTEGMDENEVARKFGFQMHDKPRALRLIEENKEKLAKVLRERFEGPRYKPLMDRLEAILNTRHYREHPIYLSNQKRQQGRHEALRRALRAIFYASPLANESTRTCRDPATQETYRHRAE